jgi:hypothetical protein
MRGDIDYEAVESVQSLSPEYDPMDGLYIAAARNFGLLHRLTIAAFAA